MRPKLRVIVIDPDKRKVREHRIETLSLARLHEIIGCACVTSFRFPDGHIALCDDAGLLRTPDAKGRLPHTWLRWYDHPVVGSIVIAGAPDADGYETSCSLDLKTVTDSIKWFGWGPLPWV